jgi:hypothetical protein
LASSSVGFLHGVKPRGIRLENSVIDRRSPVEFYALLATGL